MSLPFFPMRRKVKGIQNGLLTFHAFVFPDQFKPCHVYKVSIASIGLYKISRPKSLPLDKGRVEREGGERESSSD